MIYIIHKYIYKYTYTDTYTEKKISLNTFKKLGFLITKK